MELPSYPGDTLPRLSGFNKYLNFLGLSPSPLSSWMDFSSWCWSWGVGCRDCVLSVCGKNGLWTVPARVWTIFMVITKEVQEEEVRAQPVHHVVHAVLGLLVQGLCPRVQCLCTKGSAFPLA